jgi:hypothetical protein
MSGKKSSPFHKDIYTESLQSNKPLWIDSAKNSIKDIPSVIKISEFEDLDIIFQPNNNQNVYPFYNIIENIVYGCGDFNQPSKETILFFCDFVKKYIIKIYEICSKNNIKNVIDSLFSEENQKYSSVKNIKTFTEKSTEDFDLSNLLEIPEMEIDEDNDKDYLNFQNERTLYMNTEEYLKYHLCRQTTFLNKGKKYLLNYIQEITDNKSIDFNLDLLSYILKNKIKNIIISSIKNKCKKLIILKEPLKVEDIKVYCENELNILDKFQLENKDDISKQKRIKRSEPNTNKYIRIKDNVIIIKKFAFLENHEEAEFLMNNKSVSENQVVAGIFKLCNLVNLIKTTKSASKKT